MQSIKTGYPSERIQIDILGPLPETDRGNKYVSVVVDMYTKRMPCRIEGLTQ